MSNYEQDLDEEIATYGEWGRCHYNCPTKLDKHAAERRWNGSPICWPCWNWARGGGADAAHYWHKHLSKLIKDVDHYDLITYFPAAWGYKASDYFEDKVHDAPGVVFLDQMRQLHDHAHKQLQLMGSLDHMPDFECDVPLLIKNEES
jgi:hypothetical protein